MLKQEQARLVVEAATRELARRDFLRFVTYTKPDYQVNWHHEVICKELDNLIAGKTTRLILCLMPRGGKSELVSRRLPAYIFGKDPDAEIIASSYASDLAQRMNRDVQRIIDNPLYKELFPGTTLFGSNVRTVAQGSYLRNSDIFEIVGRRGSYRSAGVGGGITGMGAKYAIIDDPLKNRQDANSQKVRDTIWEWYTDTLYTRLTPDGRVLIIMTRWHEDDLVGRLLEKQRSGDGDQWRVVNLPAFAEENQENRHPEDKRKEGEALWPSRFSEERLAKIKSAIGSYSWAGLYQQRPAPSEGAIFLRHWWQFYTTAPERFEETIISWDMAFKDAKDSDYVVGQVWGKLKADRYLLDQVRGRMDFPATLRAVVSLQNKWPKASKIYVEDKANGSAVISTLQRDIPGLIPVNPEGGKVVRAQAVTGIIESGNVFLPSPMIAPWIGDFIEECAGFPNTTHDDQVDAMTQALIRMWGKFATSLMDAYGLQGLPQNNNRAMADNGRWVQ